MKVVIDIPEVYYDFCKVCAEINTATIDQIIIANGKILQDDDTQE